LPNEQIASIPARQEYLLALQRHWPEVLSWLREHVLPLYEPRWHEDELDGIAKKIPIIDSNWEKFQMESDRPALLASLIQWGAQFNITEAWIFESALDMLLAYFQLGSDPGSDAEGYRLWWYRARGFHARFEPKFSQNLWYPPKGGWQESWEDFRSRMNAEFRQQLSEYKRYVEVKFSTEKEEHLMRRDAEWTVRYQKGELAIAISESANLTGYSDPEQAVSSAIKTFAKLIGIRLRKRGQRPPRKLL